MRALNDRCTQFVSKLDFKKDICMNIEGVSTIIEFSFHGTNRSKQRAVYESASVLMVQRAFDEILDLKNGQRFLIIDKELCISVVGALNAVGTDVIISIVSVIDSAEPYNPHNTYEIVI